MTLHEIADRINFLFREAGLDHDVVAVVPLTDVDWTAHRIQLDPRENEPDPMKWRATERPLTDFQIVLVGAAEVGQMHQLLQGLEYLFAGLPPGQMKLF